MYLQFLKFHVRAKLTMKVREPIRENLLIGSTTVTSAAEVERLSGSEWEAVNSMISARYN